MTKPDFFSPTHMNLTLSCPGFFSMWRKGFFLLPQYFWSSSRAELSLSGSRVRNSSMPPSPGSEKSSWGSTPTISQLIETGKEQLEVGANIYSDGSKEKKREPAKEKEEKINANPLSASSNPSHEINDGPAPAEPGSELIVWWDGPEDQNPENPMNWSSTKKWANILVISVISFLV